MRNKTSDSGIPATGEIPRLFYARTDNGFELPVLDITHPLFLSSINESTLPELRRESAHHAGHLRQMPGFVKRFIGKRSHILGGYFLKDAGKPYLDGMSTLMSKLGPHLMEQAGGTRIDRKISRAMNSMAIRMRVRDICRLQAGNLIPRLREEPGRKLCLLNIAGGTATDSINTLFLILDADSSLLEGRPVEIAVLDVDTFGPDFARRCVESLSAPEGKFHGVDVSFRHVPYNWTDTRVLAHVLTERGNCVLACSSEGGLFEYGTDEDIEANLKVLHDNSPADMCVVGDAILEFDAVDPSIPAMMEAGKMSVRYLGVAGMERVGAKTGWMVEATLKNNPTYVVFSLKKN